MQIRHLDLPQSVKHKPSGSQQVEGQTPENARAPALASGHKEAESYLVSSMSERRLGLFRIVLDNFNNNGFFLLKEINDILELLSAAKNEITDKQLLSQLNNAMKSLLSLNNSLNSKEITVSFVRSVIEVYNGAGELKLNLLELFMQLTHKDATVVALKERISSFLEMLESVNFFNREAASNSSAKTSFLYFPFTLNPEDGKKRKMELVVYPETDRRGAFNTDSFSFNLNLDTDSLGMVNVFVRVRKKQVSCSLSVENESVLAAIKGGSPDLASRLKGIRFVLNDFKCKTAAAGDYLPSLLPRLEIKA